MASSPNTVKVTIDVDAGPKFTQLVEGLVNREINLRLATRPSVVKQCYADLGGYAAAMAVVFGWTPFLYTIAASDAVTYAAEAIGHVPVVGSPLRAKFVEGAVQHMTDALLPAQVTS